MTEIAQKWLNDKYPNKEIGGKIELYDKNVEGVEELTGELLIENYVNVEEIDLEHRDKRKRFSLRDRSKGKMTKVTIKNCPKLKDLNLNNNEIGEIIFEGKFLDLTRLDMLDNKLTEIDISKLPKLDWLNVARNPITKIKGLENSTELKFINFFGTPGLDGREYGEWKDAIKSILNVPLTDPLPDTWKGDLKNKLDEFKSRPTREQLDEAVKNKEKEFENHVDPNDKAKLEKMAKDKLGMVSKTDHEELKNQLDARPNITKKEWDDYSKRPKQTDLDKVKAELDKNKIDLDQANQKVQDYENGLKNKLGLDDDTLPNWKDEIDKLKKRPTSDNLGPIKELLGLSPTDTLPNDWPAKLAKKDDLMAAQDNLKKWTDKLGSKTPETVAQELAEANQNKDKLNNWKEKFGDKTPDEAKKEIDNLKKWTDKFPGKDPAKVEKELNDLKSKPAGTTLTPEQQQKLNDYDKVVRQRDARANITPSQYTKISNYMEDRGGWDTIWQDEILGTDWKAQIQQVNK